MKYIITILIVVFGIATLLLVNSLAQKAIHEEAINGCLQAGRLEITNSQGQKVTIPENYWYTDCMTKKGYPVATNK